eukprot:15924704-Heterocapsa_arctica.AAC.1
MVYLAIPHRNPIMSHAAILRPACNATSDSAGRIASGFAAIPDGQAEWFVAQLLALGAGWMLARAGGLAIWAGVMAGAD